MKLKQLAKGFASLLPKSDKFLSKKTGGTDSARYCYSIWLRHLVMAFNNGCLGTYPQVVAELGPGDSVGIGLAALISGVEQYYAFDVVNYSQIERNLSIFDELVSLFKEKAAIPGENEFPKVKPKLETYNFPKHILMDDKLIQSLDDTRLDRIKNSILNPTNKDSVIQYRVPWFDSSVMKEESVDMIFSQAVLEHVDNLRNTYKAMRLWLKSSGCISHQIDFKSHGTADLWNGHWIYSDFIWKLMRGKLPYLLNRAPYSTHYRLIKEEGFNFVYEKKIKSKSHISTKNLSHRFKCLTNDDLTTSGAFIQAIKRKARV